MKAIKLNNIPKSSSLIQASKQITLDEMINYQVVVKDTKAGDFKYYRPMANSDYIYNNQLNLVFRT
jgi:hypothetical protein